MADRDPLHGVKRPMPWQQAKLQEDVLERVKPGWSRLGKRPGDVETWRDEREANK